MLDSFDDVEGTVGNAAFSVKRQLNSSEFQLKEKSKKMPWKAWFQNTLPIKLLTLQITLAPSFELFSVHADQFDHMTHNHYNNKHEH